MKYTFAAITSDGEPPVVHSESWDTVAEANEQAIAWTILCGPENPHILGLALLCVEGTDVWAYEGPRPAGGWQQIRLP